MNAKVTDWWDADFFKAFRPMFGQIAARSTNAQVHYLIKKLNLKPGKSFLDCPCGIGRVAIPLAKKGVQVTGVDLTQSYIEELDKRTKRAKLKIKTFVNDMRKINFDSRFDAAGNLWTSLGFFAKEADDLLTLKKMFKALKPGGKFVLHIINRDWLMLNFQAHGWQDLGKTRLIESRKFDYRTSRTYSKWIYIRDGEEQTFDVSLRMYSFHELVTMFEAAGFVDIEGFGGIKDEPISRDQRMMWVFGTKPKR
jgi:cyclopropane fatty-acyl-phospholipid synthase-like methyltransferase